MYRNQKYIYLLIGFLITVVFLCFSGEIYQRIPLGNPIFTPELSYFRFTVRAENITSVLAILVTIIPWIATFIFYYVIDSVKFDRWWHWLIILAAITMIVPVLCFRYTALKLDELTVGLSADYAALNILLSVWNTLIASLFFILASFSIRWWSRNCRHTPFPQ